jgi:hypothetical protein
MEHTMSAVAADDGFGVLTRAVRDLAAQGRIGSHSVEEASLICWVGVHGLATMAVSMQLMPPEQLVGMARRLSQVLQEGLAGS